MAADSIIYASDLQADVDNVHGGLVKDSVYWQDKMVVDGRVVDKGLGMHAPRSGVGTATYDIPAEAELFRATLALAEPEGNGAVKFRIRVDGRLAYESPVVTHATKAIDVTISVKGAKRIALEVDSLGRHTSDQAVFADARFEAPPKVAVGKKRVIGTDQQHMDCR